MVNVASAVRTTYCGVGQAAPAGMVFVIIDAVVYNNGDAYIWVDVGYFSIIDSEGHEYASGGCVLPYIEAFKSTSIAPGRSNSGKVVFVVLDIAEDLAVSYLLSGAPPVLAVWDLGL